MNVLKNHKFYYLPFLLLGLFFIWQSQSALIFDFSNYYFGGRFIAEGQFTEAVYMPDYFNQQITSWEGKPYFNSYAPNTPFLALFFYLFSGFDALTAKTLFQLISLSLFLLTLYRLLKHYSIDHRWVLLLPVVLFIPFRNEILFGQVYLLVFVLLAESLLAWEKGKWWLLSILLSFAIVFKVFPVYLVLPLLFRKEWKALLGTGLMVFFWIFLSVLVSGVDVWWFFLKEIMSRAGRGEISSAYVDNYQSLLMFLKRMLIADPVENPGAWKHLPGLYIGLNSGLKVFVVIIGWFLHRSGQSKLKQFSYWIVVSFVISPYGSTYTYLLLIFPLVALLQEHQEPKLKVIFIFLMVLLCFAPLGFILKLPYPLSYARLMILLLLFATFLYENRHQIRWLWTVALSAVAVLVVSFIGKTPQIHSRQLLPSGSPLMLVSLKAETDGLHYRFMDIEGTHEVIFPLHSKSRKKLLVKNQQIYSGQKQLTNDASFKRDAWLVDDQLYYLSDEGCGIGFYGIRYQSLK